MLPIVLGTICLKHPAAAPSRRAVLAAAALQPLAIFPAVSGEPDGVSFETLARVKVNAFPGIEYMEPMIEFQQAMDALVDGSQDPTQYPFIKRRLDRFFSGGPGGIFSDRFFYAGVSAQYVFNIRYADSGPSVDADKLAWQDDIERTMEALQQLRTELKTVEPNAIVVVGCARRARDGVARWLARVPAADVERVSALLKSVRNADVNRDGQLSDVELATLNPVDQAAWRARLSLF